jgi:hypothetical protein
MLSTKEFEKAKHREFFLDAKQLFMRMMQEIVNVKTEAEALMLAEDREAKKKLDREYIPNRRPKLSNLADPYQSKTRGILNFRRLAELNLAKTRDNILTVNKESKKNDIDNKTTLLDPLKRSDYRVIIMNNRFYSSDQRTLYDTNNMVAHGKGGYAAFTLNTRGEISMFEHYGRAADDPFTHSSMNSQAPVFAAGEVRIEKGELIALNDHSGHYLPTLRHVYRALKYFYEQGIDISKTLVHLYEVNGVDDSLDNLSRQPTPDFEKSLGFVYSYNALDLYKAGLAEELAETANRKEIAVNRKNQGALLECAIKGESESVKHLLSKGVNFDVEDKQGFTPLLHAVKHGHLEIVGMLIEKGANPFEKHGAKKDTSALKMAKDSGQMAILQLLQKSPHSKSVFEGHATLFGRDNTDSGERPAVKSPSATPSSNRNSR